MRQTGFFPSVIYFYFFTTDYLMELPSSRLKAGVPTSSITNSSNLCGVGVKTPCRTDKKEEKDIKIPDTTSNIHILK